MQFRDLVLARDVVTFAHFIPSVTSRNDRERFIEPAECILISDGYSFASLLPSILARNGFDYVRRRNVT